MPIVSPWMILIAVALLGGVSAYSYHKGAVNKENEIVAAQAKDDALVQKVSDAAQEGAARAIANIRIKNVTTLQTLEKEIVKVPDYSNCMHSDAGLRAINDALTNVASQPSSIGGVPGNTSPANR